jgi:hypothetical protein
MSCFRGDLPPTAGTFLLYPEIMPILEAMTKGLIAKQIQMEVESVCVA